MALLTLSEGQIAYAGYLFPASFIVKDITHNPIMEAVELPFNLGAYAPQAKPGAKIYSVEGSWGGSGAIKDQLNQNMLTPAAVIQEIERLTPLLYNGEQQFQWRFDRWCFAQAQRPKITDAIGQGGRFKNITLDFVANNPESFGNQSRTVTATVGSAATFTNNGTYRNYPTFTLTATATGTATVTFAVPLGGNVGLSFAVTNGDVLSIITDPRGRAVTKSGSNAYGQLNLPVTNTVPNSEEVFPYLDPGTTTISVTNCTAAVTGYDTYI